MPEWTFDAEQTMAKMREIVKANPDYVYQRRTEGCVYLEDTPDGVKGSCLIGQVLIALGLPKSELAEYEGYGTDRLPWFTYEAKRVAGTAQSLQDGATIPWKYCLAAAEEVHTGADEYETITKYDYKYQTSA